jgi:hypothetical protein
VRRLRAPAARVICGKPLPARLAQAQVRPRPGDRVAAVQIAPTLPVTGSTMPLM